MNDKDLLETLGKIKVFSRVLPSQKLRISNVLQNAGEIVMAADGSGAFTDAIGMTFDLVARGLGVRSQRYSMLVNDSVVEALNLDDPGKFEVSGAEQLLEAL